MSRYFKLLSIVLTLNFFICSTFAQAKVIKVLNGKVEITYYTDIHKDVAQWAADASKYIWEKYKIETGIEPAKIEVQIADIFSMDPKKQKSDWVYGLEESSGNVCYIYISALNKKYTQSTLAHEIFHCWQEIMNLQPYSSNEWFWESTAVWAESWIYPNYNTEHEYLTDILSFLNEYFFDDNNTREYGSYLFFYYLFQKNNFSPKPVIDLVKKLQNKNQVDLFSTRDKFYSELKEYSLWNWNKEPVKKYKDTPSFPTNIPKGDSLLLENISKNGKIGSNYMLNGGGSIYVVVKIDDDIESLRFKLDQANRLLNDNLSLQALLKINGSWQYEDWSEEGERRFCRKRPEEKVDKAILILTNSKVSPNRAASVLYPYLSIDAKGKCPKMWHGKLVIKERGKTLNSELVMEEDLEHIKLEGGMECLLVKKQRVSSKLSSRAKINCPFPGCSGEIIASTNEEGQTVRYKYIDGLPGQQICRFFKEPASQNSLDISVGDKTVNTVLENIKQDVKKGGWKLNLNLEIYGKCDYVVRTETSQFACTCPGPLGTSQETGSKVTRNLCHAIFGLNDINFIPVKIVEGKGIKGEEQLRGWLLDRIISISWDYEQR